MFDMQNTKDKSLDYVNIWLFQERFQLQSKEIVN